MELFVEKYQEIKKNAKRGGAFQKVKEGDFVSVTSSIIDIAHVNAQTLIKIEEDRIFLHAQQTERKMVMGCKNKWLIKKEQTAKKRKNRLLKKLTQEKERDPVTTHTDAEFSLSSITIVQRKKTTTNSFQWGRKVRASLPKQRRLKAVDIISPPVAAALNRTGISD